MACPLGFGSAGAGKSELSPYHCVLCRGLLHDPVVTTGCRHTFCAFCVRRFRDCPTCGADIESTSPDTALASAINKILLGHAKLIPKTAGSVKVVPPPGVCPAAATASTAAISTKAASCPVAPASSSSAGTESQDPNLDLPSVLLQLALQSLAGGNPEAALARLDICADALCGPPPDTDAIDKHDLPRGSVPAEAASAPVQVGTPPAAARGTDTSIPAATSAENPDPILSRHLAAAQTSSETASRLGAILGCKADCYRRLGDSAAALHHYMSSLACLGFWRGRSREADSAMSVTHNKLGDQLFMLDRLTEAKEHYEAALQIRRRVVSTGIEVSSAAAGVGTSGSAKLGAHAGAAAETVMTPAEEAAQDLYDLAVSLCKVADVSFALHEERCRTAVPVLQQKPPPPGKGEASASAALAAAAAAVAAITTTTGSGMTQSQEQQKQDAPLTKLTELITEARGILLRQELLPYARACGLAAGQTSSPTGAGQLEAAAEASSSNAGRGSVKAEAGCSGSSSGARDAQGSSGYGEQQARSGSECLAPMLVSRYSKVWGVMEQLTGRLEELELSSR
ncbi:hypothetical protein Vretimale_4430 [Volvox reticuliferus]|uniref:RING-type domain-containing protein n=1 Tax=Volvox reticuliferus TaxID=1737510 RepID=A0A8J4C407_9CHLO|nr:hypothetical protein Vretifemale_3095 [Volvox reticuliferus]GIL99268.1 hypothetical protein Vretimale_4430 [Volvox reticuliferus]